MKIDQHISQLLYHHDCVIVPGFGGFVSNLQSAKIHPVQHQFYPPSKSLGFNIHLKRNDGLLANKISQVEAITYDEALRRITDFVNNCNENLSNRGSCYLNKVGKLYYDVEKHLRFEADTTVNYLLDSFGLTVIQSPPIKRDTLKDKVEKQVKYRDPVKSTAGVVKKKKFPWKTALILPVVGLFMWASVQTWNVYKHKSDTGNLNPFEATTNSTKEIKKETSPIIIPEVTTPSDQAIIGENVEAQPTEVEPEITVPEAKTVVSKPEETKTTETPLTFESGTKKYFVIAGAFAVHENAKKLILQLKEKGFAYAAIIDTTRQGLHMVSYNEGFSIYSEALQNLNTLKAEENSAAWLLRK